MILQLMIRQPDLPIEQSLLVGVFRTEQQCIEDIKSLMSDEVPPVLYRACSRFYPTGFIIEGVAYGELEEEPLDTYDLYVKVLQ